ncbi:MAG: hypothetical protein AVO39_05275 [delta proteobacterium MLS_D]|jgi:hypothetical protein|nr:MAG: hypothetical protein AVO39_05275 [delta proteobacterium MLS_D]
MMPFKYTRLINNDVHGGLKRPWLMVWFWVVLPVLFCFFSGHSINAASEGTFPFLRGERLTFLVTWGVIPVGEGILEVHQDVEIDGEEARHFCMTARTNGFADFFYKVRDRMDGYTDVELTRSLRYTKVSEGSSKRNVVVTYDWDEMRARYFNHGKEHASTALKPHSFDPLSMFYAFRCFDLSPGMTMEIPVSDGKKTIAGRAVVQERENIRVQGTDYDTYRVSVDMGNVDGVFKKSRDAALLIWVTVDDRRMPVRMKSSVVVGSFTVDLVSAEHMD